VVKQGNLHREPEMAHQSSASFDAGLADLPFTISPVCKRIVVSIATVFVQFEIYLACLSVIGVFLLLYHSV